MMREQGLVPGEAPEGDANLSVANNSIPPAEAPEEAPIAQDPPSGPTVINLPGTPAPAEPPAAEPPATPPADAEADAKFMEELRRRTGRTDIASLDELLKPATPAPVAPVDKTEEDKVKEREQFRNEAFRHSLEVGNINMAQVEAFNRDHARKPEELAQAVFNNTQLSIDPTLAKLMAEDPDAANQELRERFEDAFFLNEEGGTWKSQDGISRINAIADEYMKTSHAAVLGVEDEFNGEMSMRQKAKDYHNIVSSTVSSIPEKLSFMVGESKDDQVEVSYVIPQEIRDSARNHLLSPAVFKMFGTGEADPAVIKQAFIQEIQRDQLGKIISETARSYHAARQEQIAQGRRNVPVSSPNSGSPLASGNEPPKSLALRQLEEARMRDSKN